MNTMHHDFVHTYPDHKIVHIDALTDQQGPVLVDRSDGTPYLYVIAPYVSVSLYDIHPLIKPSADCTTVVYVQRNSTVRYYVGSMHGDVGILHLDIKLCEPHASIDVVGLYLLNQRQTMRITTIQHHQAPDTNSSVVLHGALSGASSVVYDSIIRIDEDATGSSADQVVKNLMLSPTAVADTKPQLEVLTNDVQCSHGSAVGYMDEEQLWYMQSRGIPHDTARRLLLEGFFGTIVQQFTHIPVRSQVRSSLDTKMQDIL